jgi:hypothetical protein
MQPPPPLPPVAAAPYADSGLSIGPAIAPVNSPRNDYQIGTFADDYADEYESDGRPGAIWRTLGLGAAAASIAVLILYMTCAYVGAKPRSILGLIGNEHPALNSEAAVPDDELEGGDMIMLQDGVLVSFRKLDHVSTIEGLNPSVFSRNRFIDPRSGLVTDASSDVEVVPIAGSPDINTEIDLHLLTFEESNSADDSGVLSHTNIPRVHFQLFPRHPRKLRYIDLDKLSKMGLGI